MNPLLRFLQRLGGEKTKIDERRRLDRLGRDEYKYCDGGRCVVLQIEMLIGKPDRLLYSSTIKKWRPPFETEKIDATERSEIANQIAKFLNDNGHNVEVQ